VAGGERGLSSSYVGVGGVRGGFEFLLDGGGVGVDVVVRAAGGDLRDICSVKRMTSAIGS